MDVASPSAKLAFVRNLGSHYVRRLLALRWLVQASSYELTVADVLAAYSITVEAARPVIERALIHVAGSEGSGKTAFIEAVLAAVRGAILMARRARPCLVPGSGCRERPVRG